MAEMPKKSRSHQASGSELDLPQTATTLYSIKLGTEHSWIKIPLNYSSREH